MIDPFLTLPRLTNPRAYVAVKQHTEAAIVMIQEPQETEFDLNALKNIGFYITNRSSLFLSLYPRLSLLP